MANLSRLMMRLERSKMTGGELPCLHTAASSGRAGKDFWYAIRANRRTRYDASAESRGPLGVGGWQAARAGSSA